MTPSSPKSACCGLHIIKCFCMQCWPEGKWRCSRCSDIVESPELSQYSPRGASAESNKAASGDSLCTFCYHPGGGEEYRAGCTCKCHSSEPLKPAPKGWRWVRAGLCPLLTADMSTPEGKSLYEKAKKLTESSEPARKRDVAVVRKIVPCFCGQEDMDCPRHKDSGSVQMKPSEWIFNRAEEYLDKKRVVAPFQERIAAAETRAILDFLDSKFPQ